MRTLTVHLLLSLLVISSSMAHGFNHSFFDEMFQEMDAFHERMEKHFSHMHHEMREYFNNASRSSQGASISLEKKDNHAEICFSHLDLKDKNLEAHYDQDTNALIIKANGFNVLIRAHTRDHYTLLSTEYRQQIVKESDHKDANASSIAVNSSAYAAETLAGQIELEHAHIDYESGLQQLKILVPFRKKTITKIPIHMKEPKEDK